MKPVRFEGKNVLLMGLGIKDGGAGAALFAHRRGARLVITDLQDKSALARSIAALDGIDAVYRLGEHREADFLSADIIIKNDGVRRSHPLLVKAAAAKIPVYSPLELFFSEVKRPYLGITGSKGKSLTTHLVAHLISCLSGGQCVAAGNNCVSPLRRLDDPQPVHALELSSWQLHEMEPGHPAPHVAVWTDFFPDHLDYYQDEAEYFADKRRITDFQKPADVLVVPRSDERLAALSTRAEKIFFCAREEVPAGCFFAGGELFFRDGQVRHSVAALSGLPNCLRVPHFLPLVAAACAAAITYTGKTDGVAGALAAFTGLPHRFEIVHRDENLAVINDSAATTPHSVLRALEAVRLHPLALIAGGGGHKNLDYGPLAEAIRRQAGRLILFSGDPASGRLLEQEAVKTHPDLHAVSTMEEAVSAGIDFLRRQGGGTLLLSPGSSGAPLFADLFARGDLFRSCVQTQLKTGAGMDRHAHP